MRISGGSSDVCSSDLFIGGLDTVSTNMGLQMLHLAQHPEDQRFLRENPARIPHAIEELMRAYAPVTVFRTCTRDVTFKGVEMKAGEKVAMMTTRVKIGRGSCRERVCRNG